MEYDFLKTCLIFVASFIFLIIGIPCWIIGSFRPFYYAADFLVSLPIYPTTEDGMSYWIGSKTGNAIEEYSQGIPIEIPVSVELSYKASSKVKLDLYLIHNLWGYNVSMHINEAEFFKLETKDIYKLNPIGNTTIPSMKYMATVEMPKELQEYGAFRIKCPFSTLITIENELEPKCSREIGYFMKLVGKYQVSHIGTIIPLEKGPYTLPIIFDNITVLPYDFIETPQMYLAAWTKTDSTILAGVGSTFTTIGLISVIVLFILFFICNSDGSDE